MDKTGKDYSGLLYSGELAQSFKVYLEQDFHWESTVYVMWPFHSFVIEGRLFYQFER